MGLVYVFDYDYLSTYGYDIDKLELKNEDYKEKAKESRYRFENIELIFALLQFCREHNFCEFVIHFTMNERNKGNILKIFEDELSSRDKITATFKTSQLWFYLGTRINSVWKIRVITKERTMINKELTDFIAKIMRSLTLNKDNLKISTSLMLNSQMIESDLHVLKIKTVSSINTITDINKLWISAKSQSKLN